MPPKRRRRFHGIYYHSSPPKVMPMNGQMANDSGKRRRDVDDFSVKLSTIRIWMHEKDIGKLTRILFAGQGNRLRQQASTNPKVKRFLAAVPYVMNSIKDVHQSVINNNLEALQANLKAPAPPALITCKDANGLNVIHKAAGLSHAMLLEYLIGIWPDGVQETDITGKTPLHWAASAKSNMRCYKLLTQAGCDEEALDYKMKTPSYYRHKPNEIERSFLTYIPEAPRVAQDVATDWDALSDSAGEGFKKSAILKVPIAMNGISPRSDVTSVENTSESDAMIEGNEEKKELELGTTNGNETKNESQTELLPKNIEEEANVLEEVVDSKMTENEKLEEQPKVDETAKEENDESDAIDKDEEKEENKSIENDTENLIEDEKKNEIQSENEQPKEDEIREDDKLLIKEEKSENDKSEINAMDENDVDDVETSTKEIKNEIIKTEKEKIESKMSPKTKEGSQNGERNSSDDDDDDDDDDQKNDKSSSIGNGKFFGNELDENHNHENKSIITIEDPPSTALDYEDFVEGAAADNQVQSNITDATNTADDEENRISELIESGNMEQLAQIVLNGEGDKLLSMNSREPDIQAFLNNVPAYMSKIRRVHLAARKGSLMQLQSALDRRKFAIAKDVISPNGASPLHVAILFGHSDIVRYLAGRFPETTSITDDNGRTALHYAATINDNGHFYNILIHLGANPMALDNLGNPAEFYLNANKSNDVLSYRQLLRTFDAEGVEEELLKDQGQVQNGDCLQTNPVFKTEQGRYLAQNLSEPLIKGLTEIAEKRPTDPVAYLAGYLQNVARVRGTNRQNSPTSSDTNSTALINSEYPSSPEKEQNSSNHPINIDAVTNANDDPISLSDGGGDADDDDIPKMEIRDEHGQTMLHFACARSHRHNGLFNLIEESQIDITYRDELYRTARDVSLQANQPDNAKEIDRYILSLAVVGDVKPFEYFLISGYDHILDVEDNNGKSIIDITLSRGHDQLVNFFRNMQKLEELREELHQAIRDGQIDKIKDITSRSNGLWLIKAKNYYGRTALHIAVLRESEEIIEHFVNLCPAALHIGDNLERTSLHYAMGINAVESVCRILIQKGAKRTMKDLKGRQPTYYFMNKVDILRLQEEEDEHH